LPRSLSFAIGHASGCAAEAARWGFVVRESI
jgi:hypothetical protein